MCIYALKNCVLGLFDPVSRLQYQLKPKKVHSCMSLHHFEPSSMKICVKRGYKYKFLVIFHFTCLPRSPHGRISTKFCTAVEVVDIITYDKCFSDWSGDVDSVRVENGPLPLTKPVAVNALAAVLYSRVICKNNRYLMDCHGF